jgi:hypothetical protein
MVASPIQLPNGLSLRVVRADMDCSPHRGWRLLFVASGRTLCLFSNVDCHKSSMIVKAEALAVFQ